MTLKPPTAAAAKRYAAERASKSEGQLGWLDARKAHLAKKQPLKSLKNSPEDHVSRGSIVDQLGQVRHPEPESTLGGTKTRVRSFSRRRYAISNPRRRVSRRRRGCDVDIWRG